MLKKAGLTLSLSAFLLGSQAIAQTAETQSGLRGLDGTESTPAQIAATTPWEICNQTSFVLRAAVGSDLPNIVQNTAKNKIIVKGWIRIFPGQCAQAAITPTTGARYLFAESEALHRGGIREWAGKDPLCVNPEGDFILDNLVSCSLQGYKLRRFMRIDPTKAQSTLIEADDYEDRAEVAGLQRLLMDAGFKINRVDGYDGKRTRDLMRRFKKEQGLAKDLSVKDTMIKLAEYADGRRDQVGLNICNKTNYKNWLAIGFREDGSWQSRGWWKIEPDQCLRPWSKPMAGSEMHIYAQQDIPRPVQADAYDDFDPEAPAQIDVYVLENPLDNRNEFCIAEGKFSALGREFCNDKGYLGADFKAVIAEGENMTIDLTQSDFKLASRSSAVTNANPLTP